MVEASVDGLGRRGSVTGAVTAGRRFHAVFQRPGDVRGASDPQLEPGVFGVPGAAARLQPSRTLGHEPPDEEERHDGEHRGHGGRLAVAEQRPGQVHAKHADGGVDDRPGCRPGRETLCAVRGGRHRHDTHEHAGERAAH